MFCSHIGDWKQKEPMGFQQLIYVSWYNHAWGKCVLHHIQATSRRAKVLCDRRHFCIQNPYFLFAGGIIYSMGADTYNLGRSTSDVSASTFGKVTICEDIRDIACGVLHCLAMSDNSVRYTKQIHLWWQWYRRPKSYQCNRGPKYRSTSKHQNWFYI